MSRYLGLALTKSTTFFSMNKLIISLLGFLMGVFITGFFAGFFLEE